MILVSGLCCDLRESLYRFVWNIFASLHNTADFADVTTSPYNRSSAQGVTSFDKLCSVLGILNFVRRFVSDFAGVTASLVSLTRIGYETVSRLREAWGLS